jgi:hypothetical protein
LFIGSGLAIVALMGDIIWMVIEGPSGH